MTVQTHFLLRTSNLRLLLEERNLTNGDLAEAIGLSRNYWSQLLNRRRHLTPRVRRALLTTFDGVAPEIIWDRISASSDVEVAR